MAFSPIQFFRRHVLGNLPGELTSNQLKWGAILWGDALILFGALVAWERLKEAAPLGNLPYVLAVAGFLLRWLMLIPRFSKPIYLTVLTVFMTFGILLAMVFLPLFFYLIVTPMGLLLRLSGKDFLRTRQTGPPTWVPHAGKRERRRYFRLF